jgi:hypothetical protein
MKCSRCGFEIEGKALFCPQCGRKLDVPTKPLAPWQPVEQEGDEAPGAETAPAAEPAEGRARGCRSSLAVAGIAFVVVLVIGGLALAAVYQGMRDRTSIQSGTALEHYTRGEAHLAEERYELAIAEFEQALRLDPSMVEAADRLAEVQALLAALPTPTSILQRIGEEAYWDEMQSALAGQNWARALELADQIVSIDPQYRRQELDQVLYEAAYQLGLQYVQESRMEDAVRLFDRALALRPDSAQASLAQSMAKLYMDGLRYVGADWATAIDRLSMLFAIDPDYRDVRARLRQAYVAYAEQLTARDDWCLAALHYRRAEELAPSADTSALAQEATERCGTPPAAGDPSVPGGGDTTPTPGATGPVAPSGTYVGRVDSIEHVAAAGIYVRGRILDANGSGVANVRVRIQAWDWFAYAISDGSGQFSFDGLGNPVTYTLSLPDLPSVPVEAPTELTQLTWIVFEQAR